MNLNLNGRSVCRAHYFFCVILSFVLALSVLLSGCGSARENEVQIKTRASLTTEKSSSEQPKQSEFEWNKYSLNLSLSDKNYYSDACGLIDAICEGLSSYDAENETIAKAVSDNIFYNFPPSALCSFSVNGKTVLIEWKETNPERRKKLVEDFGKTVSSIINSLGLEGLNEEEKALLLYRWTAKHVKYFETDYTDKDTSAYSALTKGYTICYGFADCYNYLLRQVGITAELLRGGRRGDNAEHGWSLVKLNGKWYHCDPTWERSTSDGNGLIFFGMTDKVRSEYVNKNPVCDFGLLETTYDSKSASDTRYGNFHHIKNWKNLSDLKKYLPE